MGVRPKVGPPESHDATGRVRLVWEASLDRRQVMCWGSREKEPGRQCPKRQQAVMRCSKATAARAEAGGNGFSATVQRRVCGGGVRRERREGCWFDVRWRVRGATAGQRSEPSVSSVCSVVSVHVQSAQPSALWWCCVAQGVGSGRYLGGCAPPPMTGHGQPKHPLPTYYDVPRRMSRSRGARVQHTDSSQH